MCAYAPPSVQGARRTADLAQLDEQDGYKLRMCVRFLEEASVDGAIKVNAALLLVMFAEANDASRAAVAAAGAIFPLVELLRSGSEEGKKSAAAAL
jgi:hypothetical protein